MTLYTVMMMQVLGSVEGGGVLRVSVCPMLQLRFTSMGAAFALAIVAGESIMANEELPLLHNCDTLLLVACDVMISLDGPCREGR